MTETEQDQTSRIPTFSSHEEEARFWDTHEFTEFQDELRPVEVQVAKPLSHVLQVRLDEATMGSIATRARAKGLSPSTLARMWILEQLAAGQVA